MNFDNNNESKNIYNNQSLCLNPFNSEFSEDLIIS